MPRGDRTGPAGMGPLTGRAGGYCSGYEVPGFANPGGGGIGRRRGFGRGLGRGSGRGRAQIEPGYYGYPPFYQPYGVAPLGAAAPAPSREHELEMLESQAKGIEQTLDDIRKRISELEKEQD